MQCCRRRLHALVSLPSKSISFALQRITLLRSAEPSQRNSSNVSGSMGASNDEAGASQTVDEVSCFGTGMEVTCSASYDDGPGDEAAAAPSGNGSAERAAPEALQSAQPAQPAEEALSGFQQVLAAALLVSPFFFWGTSMVGMKVTAFQNVKTTHSHCSNLPSLVRLHAPWHAYHPATPQLPDVQSCIRSHLTLFFCWHPTCNTKGTDAGGSYQRGVHRLWRLCPLRNSVFVLLCPQAKKLCGRRCWRRTPAPCL
jgi:hypothetical protein